MIHHLLLLFLSALMAAAAPMASTSSEPNNCPECLQGRSPLAAEIRTADALSQIARAALNDGDFCTRDGKNPFRDQAAQEYAKLFPKKGASTDWYVPHGNTTLTLNGTDEEIGFAKQMLGARPPQSWPAKAAGCKTILCALSALFGSEESALRALSIAKRTGYIVSLSQENFQEGLAETTFTAEEIRSIDDVLHAVPSNFFHLESLKYFYRFPRGYYRVGHEGAMATATLSTPRWNGSKMVLDPGNIEFFDSAFTSGPANARYTVAHELAHQVDHTVYLRTHEYGHRKSKFSWISNWRYGTDPSDFLSYDESSAFSREYGKANPLEDWATAVGDFAYFPNATKAAAPKKYAFVKHVLFQDREVPPPGGATLSALLKKRGGTAGAIKSCLSTLTSVTMSMAFFLDPGKTDSTLGMAPKDIGLASPCLTSFIQNLGDDWRKQEESYCLGGGTAALADMIRDRAGPGLTGLFTIATEYQHFRTTRTSPPACRGKSADDATCFRMFFSAEAPKHPALKAFTKTEQDQMAQTIFDKAFAGKWGR